MTKDNHIHQARKLFDFAVRGGDTGRWITSKGFTNFDLTRILNEFAKLTEK